MCVFVSLTCLVAPVTLLAPLPLHFQPLLNASAWPPRAEALRLDARAISGPPAALEPIDRLPFPLTLIGWFNRGYPSRRRSTETVTGRWIDGGRGARALPSRPVPSRLFLLARHFLIEPLPCCHVGHLDCDWDLIPFISSWLKLSFIDLFIFFIYIYIKKGFIIYLFIYLFQYFLFLFLLLLRDLFLLDVSNLFVRLPPPPSSPLPPPLCHLCHLFRFGIHFSFHFSIQQNENKMEMNPRAKSILIDPDQDRFDRSTNQIKLRPPFGKKRRTFPEIQFGSSKKKDPSKEE